MKIKVTADHISRLIKNIEDVQTLVDIHVKVTGGGKGNQTKVNVLNKSGILIVTTCWEVFIEDLAKLAFEYLIDNASHKEVIPKKVRVLALKPLLEAEDKDELWTLAGDGWKKVLRNHADKVIGSYVGSFNTPKTKQIDDLFNELIGLKSVSASWYWSGASNLYARKRLDGLVVLRGDIAHKLQPNHTVLKNEVIENARFIQRLAEKTSNHVAKYLYSKTGRYPWNRVRYARIR